jgi:pimeloyl-ACP methyl ester carboxylesterase
MAMGPLLQRVTIDGAAFHYVATGRGDPLVLVHGSLGDYRSWQAQLEPFARHYRVIAYSRRYHFPNAWAGDGADYSPALHGADLGRLIDAIGLAPCRVAASSYGAFSALWLAAERPALVRALVLGEPPAFPILRGTPGEQVAEDFLASTWRPAGAIFRAGHLAAGVERFLDGVLAPGAFGRMPEEVRATLLDNATVMGAETNAPGYYADFSCQDAARVQAPALLLTGERSPRLFHLVTDELERCIPQAERAVIPGTSHSMHSGNPLAYNASVLDFLGRH